MLIKTKGPIIFSVCGGEVNFEGRGVEKGRFDKEGTKIKNLSRFKIK